ncbi:MAG: bifunctional phosphoglucose/phosphomannose isomerase [Actinobacteria bacterium]|nr:bifunctional phosphoglucose/phosphomannose isomerase [Actinomycetota bacterium]
MNIFGGNILDDPEKIKALDTEDMLGVEENFYRQLQQAKIIGEKTDISKIKNKNFTGIAFSGMGGSGFSGDIIKNLVKYEIQLPVEIVKGYKLPAFINKGWLVIAVSYSGDTEETIAIAEEALKRGCEVIFSTSGGKMEKLALENSKCLVKVPGSYQPRAAAGYLFLPLYILLARLGIIKADMKIIERAIETVREKSEMYNRNVPARENFAKKIALEIGSGLPVIYGFEGVMASVAFRWKCQVNENSKCPGFWNEFPELNHNETVGWERLKEITKNFVLIIFKDGTQSQKINTRINTTQKLIRDNFSKIIEIEVEGKSDFEKALSIMYLGGMVSVYLALLNNINPTPVDKIKVLKAELAKINNV